MNNLDPNEPVYYDFVEAAGFDFCNMKLKKDWIAWIGKRLPDNAASLPVESLPYLPSPEVVDIPLLVGPADFSGKDRYLPTVFRSNPSKLTELAKFNGALLLARLRMAIDRGRRFDEEEWSYRLRRSISITTIRDSFPAMPASLVQPTPASA